MESRQRKMLQDRGALPKEEGDVVREYKAMHEENFLSSWLRKDVDGKEERRKKVDSVVCKRGSLLANTVDSSSQPTPMEICAVMSTCACCGKAGHEKAKCRIRNAKCSNCGKTGHP